MRTVTVTGQGRAAAVPDTAVLAVAVSVREPDVATAHARTAEVAGAAREVALRRLSERDVATAGIGLWPHRDPDAGTDGFEANHRLTLRCPDLDVAGEVLGELAQEIGDALRVEDVSLRVGDEGPAVLAAREAAFTDARARAEHLAGLAGTRLGEVQQVQEGYAPATPLAAVAARSGALSPGEASVEVGLTVTWELVD
jgi:uncharacterized protein YggE